jgi:uncharacterized protein (TIGR02186 family)
MIRREIAAVLAIMFLIAIPIKARAQALVTDLSDYHVAITSSFTGTQLLLFGAFGRNIDPTNTDLIVVVRGPSQKVTMRRRSRQFGIWANADKVEFASVPGYYQVASTKSLDGLASTQLLARNQIGLNYLRLEAVTPDIASDPIGAPVDDYRSALVRAKIRDGLYREDIGSVTFVSPSLFRQTIYIPANVPIGDYRVEVYLVSDGDILSAQSSPLFIGKTGLEREIFLFAHRLPLAFGLIAIMLAVIAGFVAGEIFRKE